LLPKREEELARLKTQAGKNKIAQMRVSKKALVLVGGMA